ncbi:MAG: hypothetical protein HYS87_01960 [Candidatus Colwellbacteria bacterium]|nr:hypothetical protein [Candidatus Colwellbacteria bacterium]
MKLDVLISIMVLIVTGGLLLYFAVASPSEPDVDKTQDSTNPAGYLGPNYTSLPDEDFYNIIQSMTAQ